MNRRHFILAVQIVITLAIFALIFHHINFKEAVDKVSAAMPAYMVIAFVLLLIQIIVAALRWIQLLKIAGVSPPRGQFIQSFTVGSFVNSAVPGGIGGDAMRVWKTVRSGATLKLALHIILLDRVISLLGLSLLVIISSLLRIWILNESLQPIYIIGLIVSVAPIASMIVLLLVNPFMTRFAGKLPRLLAAVHDLSLTTGAIVRHPVQVFILGGLVMLGHFLMIIALLFLVKGMHIFLSPIDAFLSMPTALLLSSIPITPGGWGIREGAMVLVLKPFGIIPEVALSISILFGVFSIFAHVPTMLFYLYKNTMDLNLRKSNLVCEE